MRAAAVILTCGAALADAQTWPVVTTTDLIVVPQSTVGRASVNSDDDGSGGMWVVWSDRRPGIGTENAIWGQHLDRDGRALWATASRELGSKWARSEFEPMERSGRVMVA